jgi:hypothetical protein
MVQISAYCFRLYVGIIMYPLFGQIANITQSDHCVPDISAFMLQCFAVGRASVWVGAFVPMA